MKTGVRFVDEIENNSSKKNDCIVDNDLVIKIEQSYACKICFLQFNRRFNALRHARIHSSRIVSSVEQLKSEAGASNIFSLDREEIADEAGEDVDLNPSSADGSRDAVSDGSLPYSDNHLLKVNGTVDSVDEILGREQKENKMTASVLNRILLEENFDFDSIDSDDSSEYTESSEESDDLDEFTSDKLALYENSKLSVKDHAAAILSFSIRHNSSRQCISDLLTLLTIHLPENNRAISSITALQNACNGWKADKTSIVEYCEQCYNLWPQSDVNMIVCPTKNCKGQRYKDNDTSRKIKVCFYVKTDVADQVRLILERKGMWQKIKDVVNRRGQPVNSVKDVIDGKEYRNMCTENGVLFNNSNLTFTFNIDGVALFKSSCEDIWPIYLAINEIPPKERFLPKNIVLWGVWQGRGKPPTYAFMNPFAEDLKHLADRGITINVTENGLPSEYNLKFYAILCSMDLIAKAQILNMVQHNGDFGCKDCLTKGGHVKSKKGYAHEYSFDESQNAEARTDVTFLADGVSAYECGKKVNGIKGISALFLLPNFSLVKGVVIDYMHGLLLGITKMLLYLWFDPSEHRGYFSIFKTYPSYFIGHEIRAVDDRLKKMKPIDYLSRRPRILSGNLPHLKANELRSWLLYYSLPCLDGLLPKQHWNHYAQLVEAVHLFLRTDISERNIQRAEKLLKDFYKYFVDCYGEHKRAKAGLNIHNLYHLADYVRNWGPAWAWSCFGFESLNGTLLKHVHGTKNVCHQIIATLSGLKEAHDIKDSSNIDPRLRKFMNNMLSSDRRKQKWNKEVGEFSLAVMGNERLDETVISVISQDINCGMILGKTEVYHCLKLDGVVYTGKHYRRARQTANYVAYFENGDEISILSIKYFVLIICTSQVFAVGTQMKKIDGGSIISDWESS